MPSQGLWTWSQPAPALGRLWPYNVCFLPADGRCHGNDDPQHPCPTAALRVETPQLAGGVVDLGRQPCSSLLACAHSQDLPPGRSVGVSPSFSAAKGSAGKNEALAGNHATPPWGPTTWGPRPSAQLLGSWNPPAHKSHNLT